MADAPSRFGSSRPHVEPGYLGVGWSTEVERPLKGGRRCPNCGRQDGSESHYPRGVFCLACLGMHPADEREARRDGVRTTTVGGDSTVVDAPKVPCGHRRPGARRLTKAEERVVMANLHGRVWLAARAAEKAGAGNAASRYRLWLSMYQDGEISEAELGEWAEAAGIGGGKV